MLRSQFLKSSLTRVTTHGWKSATSLSRRSFIDNCSVTAKKHASLLNKQILSHPTLAKSQHRFFSSQSKQEEKQEQENANDNDQDQDQERMDEEYKRQERKEEARKMYRKFYPAALAFSIAFAIATNNETTAPFLYKTANLQYPPPKAEINSSPTMDFIRSLMPANDEPIIQPPTEKPSSDHPSSDHPVVSTTASTSASIENLPLIPGQEHITDPLCKKWDPAPWTWYEIIKTTALWTVFPLAPLRLLCIIPCLASSWLFSSIALMGLPHAAKENKYTMHLPRSAWRRWLLIPSAFFARLAIFFAGFMFIHTKGKLAKSKDAPILVANHVSSSDALIMYSMNCTTPGFISKAEVIDVPLLGNILVAMGSLLLDRSSPNSRAEVQHEINRRALYNKALAIANEQGIAMELKNGGLHTGPQTGFPSIHPIETKEGEVAYVDSTSLIIQPGEKEFHHVCIFPEGTTTCGKALVDFKLGAFRPGVPVQPVVIHYPFYHFNPTYAGKDGVGLLLRMVSQFYNSAEVEYLPPYIPSPEEQRDPVLYAKNVRQLMAQTLNQPVVDVVAY